ncbi:MAG: glycosyltransferase family 9 protein [Gammaproteobacteria bacterium]|nr:glycosyltransferase family 9 protein [Gammaproteobacteria bacterium]
MPLTFTAPPRSICLLRLSALGDVSHVLPMVRQLQQQWPETKISWIIGSLEAEMIDGLTNIELIIYNKKSGKAGRQQLKRQLAERNFDLLLMMQVALRASLISRWIKAPLKLGFDRRRARDFQWLFSNRKIAAQSQQHVLDGFFGFLTTLGIPAQAPQWHLPLPTEAIEFAQQRLPENQPILIINACSSNRSRNFRNWSADRYAQVAQHAHQHGMKVVLSGSPHPIEIEMAAEIQNSSSVPIINLVGKTRIKQLLAVLARASVVISPDTGPAHMANALGTPVIGLYASSNPKRTGPYNALPWCVNRYPDALKKYLNKTESEVRWGQRVRHPEAMLLIQVKEVTEKLDALLAWQAQT